MNRNTRKYTSLMLCLFSSFIVQDVALERKAFKTCNQSHFCKRLRSSPEISLFKLLEETLNETENGIEGSILNTNTNISFSFLLQFLQDDTLRLKINEAEVTCPRYQPKFVLVSEPQLASFPTHSIENGIHIYRSNAFTVNVFVYPFKLAVYQANRPLIVVNDLNKFVFEHIRPKPDKSTENYEWIEIRRAYKDIKRCGPMAVGMDFSFPSASNLYGLPLHAGSLSLQSTKIQQTVGVFWLNASETWVDIDTSSKSNVHDSVKQRALNAHFISETGILDVFLFVGPSFYDVTRQYCNLTGPASFPPYFSLGYHQAVWNDMDTNVVKETARIFNVHRIPLDVIWLNIPFTDMPGFTSWDAPEFLNLPNTMKILAAKRRKLMVSTVPFIQANSNYLLRNEAILRDFFVKNKNEYNFACNYLDFFNPAVVEYWSSLFEASTNDVYICNDKNEPLLLDILELTIPKDFIHFGDREHRELHNVYGMKNAMATYEGLLKRSGGTKRPFVVTRSHFAGTQRYAAVWTGGNQANWSHLKASYAMCLSLALGGISFCGADIGGYNREPDKQLLVRWYQAAVYLPFFRSNSSDVSEAREPYRFDVDTKSSMLASIRERLSLIPFFYTLFWQHMQSGAPVIRPLVMEFPTEKETFEIDDQLLLGESILVKVISEPDVREVDVYFPGQNEIWYNKYIYQRVTTRGYKSVPVTPEAIPVYYRGGSIIPEKYPFQISATLSLGLDHFKLIVSLDGNKTASGFLYIDEGDNFDYRSGEYLYMKFSYANNRLISRFSYLLKHVGNKPSAILCLFWLLIGLLLVATLEEKKFRKCDETSFCKRLRSLQPPEISPFKLLADTINETENGVAGFILNTNSGILYSFLLQFLVDDTIRLKINEAEVTCPRYQPSFVLVSEPQPAPFKILSVENEVRVYRINAFTVNLFVYPFKLEVYRDDEALILVNDLNKFVFEHHRQRPENSEDAEWVEVFQDVIDNKRCGPMAVGMDFSFPKASNIYGLPLHAESVSLHSTRDKDPYRLYNLDVHNSEINEQMALHGGVPFIQAHGIQQTVGIFWLNASDTWVDIDSAKLKIYESEKEDESEPNTTVKRINTDAHFISETGIVDVFLLLGPSFYDVMRQYSNLTGTASLPPYFSLGYHQSLWRNANENLVKDVTEAFDRNDIPLDAIWLSLHYTDSEAITMRALAKSAAVHLNKPFTWDSVAFPNPLDMIDMLSKRGRKLVVSVDPFINVDEDSAVHNYAVQHDFYVTRLSESNYCAGRLGASKYLDFFNPALVEYWATLFRPENFKGTTDDVHIWTDWNEPSVFDGPEFTMSKDCIHYGNWEHRDVHNVYGMKNVMATHEGLLKRSAGTKRPFILTRSHFAGTQRYAAIWTGQNQAHWSHLKASFAMCLSSALGGISFCGADIGGFFEEPDTQLLIRWYQAAVYLPLFRANASRHSKERHPYQFDWITNHVITNAIKQRLTLIPFMYTLFWQHTQSGAPVIRPLVMAFPTENEVFEIDDQLLLGESILVKVVSQPDVDEIDVYFPGTNEIWYGQTTFQQVRDSGYRNVAVTINKIPVYYRGGSIIPSKFPKCASATLSLNNNFNLTVYLDVNSTASGFLYVDEGDGFNYRNGEYLYIEFVYSNNQLISRFVDKITFKTKIQIDQVSIIGIPDIFETAIIHSDKRHEKLKLSYRADMQGLHMLTVKQSLEKQWTLSLFERNGKKLD